MPPPDGGIGDDVFSLSFDGSHLWTGGVAVPTEEAQEEEEEGKKEEVKEKEEEEEEVPTSIKRLSRQYEVVSPPSLSPSESCDSADTPLAVGDVIGCCIDLGEEEAWFMRNGRRLRGSLRFHGYGDMVTPAVSFSAGVK